MELFDPPETIYAYPNWDISGVAKSNRSLLNPSSVESVNSPTALYIHVPYCISLCQFCGFTKTNRFKAVTLDEFTDTVIKEMELVAEQLGARGSKISAIYFGGGTPSVLSLRHVETIMEAIYRLFSVDSKAELSFEGECKTLLKNNYLEGLAAAGFERISYGVQTLHEGARKVLNLKPTLKELELLANKSQKLFKDVTTDLIFGWHGQNEGAVEQDTKELCERLSPLSLELFAFEPADASPKFIRTFSELNIDLPNTDQLRALRERACEVLDAYWYKERSYTYFSKQKDIGTNFGRTYADCFYGFDGGQVLGFGRGSQSFFRHKMWAFGAKPGEHQKLVDSNVIPATIAGHYLPFERESVNWPRRGWIDHDTVEKLEPLRVKQKLLSFQEQGLVKSNKQAWELTEKGRDRVPALIYAMMPSNQIDLYQRDFDFNTDLRAS